MKFGVLVYPGSNCDHDCYHATKHVFSSETEYVWHKEEKPRLSDGGFDCLIVPGGFSYGDYLRPGAIASYSPVMDGVREFAEDGGLVIGICNGFQILCEAGLLPGALIRNKGLKFICKTVALRVENNKTPFTTSYEKGEVVNIPIAHADGSYYCDDETLAELEEGSRVVFRYSTPEGEITNDANPNGAVSNIAGIINEKGNVLGMMPHPERAIEEALSMTDGRGVFESLLKETA